MFILACLLRTGRDVSLILTRSVPEAAGRRGQNAQKSVRGNEAWECGDKVEKPSH